MDYRLLELEATKAGFEPYQGKYWICINCKTIVNLVFHSRHECIPVTGSKK